MTERIAVFHTHLGAMLFHRELTARGREARMAPVPRRLSASCGTCVRFAGDFDPRWAGGDLDRVYEDPEGACTLLWEE